MKQEKRLHRRFVVAGLGAEFDGKRREILDISASAVRIQRHGDEAPPKVAQLHLYADGGVVDVRLRASLARADAHSLTWVYHPPTTDWEERLARLDVFGNFDTDPFAG